MLVSANLQNSISGLSSNTKKQPLIIPDNVYRFLMEVTTTTESHCNNTIGEFVRKSTMEEVRRIVQRVYEKGFY